MRMSAHIDRDVFLAGGALLLRMKGRGLRDSLRGWSQVFHDMNREA